MKDNNTTDEILNGNMINAILGLAVPIMLNSLLQTFYNLTDAFWLGRLGTDELAAINLVSPIQNIIINIGSGITVAALVLISQLIGAKKLQEARMMANQAFCCAILFAVALGSIVAFFSKGIVGWLGAEGDVYRFAKTYMTLCLLDIPFLFCVNIYDAIHKAQGDSVRPLFMNFLGISINMVLDPLLMIVFKWGVAGAALSTVFAKFVPACICFVLLHNRAQDIYLDLRHTKFEKDKLLQIASIGFPSAIGGSTMQLGFLLMTKTVLTYGTTAMAAYGIGNKVNGLISLPSNGIGSAVATIVGQNYGAGQLDRVKRGYILARRMATVFLLVGGMILSRPVISTAIVSIFSDDPEVVSMAADFLSVMAFWCFTNATHNTTTGLFQGSGHTEVTMISDIVRLWGFRFATLFFCEKILNMGVRSVWYSVVVSNGLCAFCLWLVYLTGYWKKPRNNKKTKEQ